MGTYKNDYKRSEDECLWEIHEIRNKLHNELKKESFSQINEKAKVLFETIKKKYSKEVIVK